MLTEDERMKLAERWMEVAPEGFKVIVHVGSTCVKSSKRLAEHAQKIGAWGIGAMAPPFPKVGRIEELVKYCEEIACGAPALPFYFYHIPAFNGAFLSMVAFLEAVDGRIPNFAGIKYTFESLYEYNQCRLYKNGKFDMLHGQDETILPCLAMGGAQGGIGGTTNYNGKELHRYLSKHGKPVIWNWHAERQNSHGGSYAISSVTIVETSLAVNAWS